ncbi:MAG: RNA-binding S4 domain-containing protein [Cyanobacteria bacterium HKST-UBA04]|nr:RNA-binding S4 domain-containing protein [Cyanobacteria bacterium HKST-UBA04]
MRLDKFLKLSRLIKRRSVANALCDAGGVTLNGKMAKASTAICVGDELVLTIGQRTTRVRVARVPEGHVPAQDAEQLYQIL